MGEREKESVNSEWATWKCVALTGALCSIPLFFPFLKYPIAVSVVWVTLILIYLGLVKFFGSGFVVAGAIIVLLLSIFMFLLSPRFFSWYYEPDVSSENIKAANLLFHA